MDCAASSITRRPCSLAKARIGSISAHWPKRCTGMMAFVLAVIFAFASFTSMLKQIGQMSVKTGTPPSRETAPAVAKKVKAGQSTSSPGCKSIAMSASSSASVPEETEMACFAPVMAATSFSNCSISGPMMKRPCCSTRVKAAWSSGSSGRFWALTSRRGTMGERMTNAFNDECRGCQ